jgi:hypothetical protein
MTEEKPIYRAKDHPKPLAEILRDLEAHVRAERKASNDRRK